MNIKETFSKLNSIIKGKKIVCVPIVSSINRTTNEYKLDCDGNINRIVTTFSHANDFKELIIFLPDNHESMNILKEFKEKNNGRVHFRYTSYFGKHASEQRSKPECYSNTLRLVKKYFYNYDYIFIESQYLANNLILDGYNDKLIFYNNVCEIELDGLTKSRSFTVGYDKLNKYLVGNCKYTICVSPETTKYWQSFIEQQGILNKLIINCPYLIDRNLSYFNYTLDRELEKFINELQSNGFTIIYLPYRLTDEGYQIDKVIDYINTEFPLKKIAILFSDPNDSGYIENIKEKFNQNQSIKYLKVSTNRNTYYTLLDSKNIIIPYFEDIAFVNHASIHEMFDKRSNCLIVLDKTQTSNKIKDYGTLPINRINWY